MLDQPGINLRLGTGATADDLRGFDEVIIATGVTPRDPGIPADPGAQVLSYIDVLHGAPRRPRVAVIGAGGIGFDVAESLVHAGPQPDAGPRPRGAANGASALPGTTRGGLADPTPRTARPRRSGCCSARRKSPGAAWARPPAGFTAPAWR